MLYTHQIDHCLSDAVGAHGLGPDRFNALLEEARAAVERLRQWHADSSLPLLRLPERADDLRAIAAAADDCRKRFDTVLILGTGGSSLGGRSLYALAAVPGAPLDGPKLHFIENVDPHSFETLLGSLDPARTGIVVISKSGGTAETMTQLLCCLAWQFDALGAEAAGKHVTAIVEPGENALRQLAGEHGFHTLDHDPKVGGRYSVLSLVGLLPASIAGLDASAVRAGALDVLRSLLDETALERCAPVAGACVSVGLARHCGATMSVLFPYIDRLAPFALWYRQLWAESIGKDGLGTTPLRAMGTVDQHSQLQLYLDGPADKMFTIVMGPSAGAGPVVDPALCTHQALAPLKGRRMGDLLDACQRATAETLAARGRPVRIMRIDAVDERTLGALMMHFMLETIVAAHLLGVDPFDQPAVEEGKQLARHYMEESGDPKS
jgi:glucose-6-phosphate isomerase